MTQNFDPKAVLLLVGGKIIDGFAPGTFISVEYDADQVSVQVGSDGQAVWSKQHNRAATVTVTLMPGSQGNLTLSSLLNLDHALGDGRVPLVLTDPSTVPATTHVASSARVLKEPNTVYANEAQAREWQIKCASLVSQHGMSLDPR